MSGRSAQCSECTTVFDVESTTGLLPDRCPKCREDAKAAKPKAVAAKASRGRAPRKPHGGARRVKSVRKGSSAIVAAKLALQDEIQELEAQIETRREALEALEAVA